MQVLGVYSEASTRSTPKLVLGDVEWQRGKDGIICPVPDCGKKFE